MSGARFQGLAAGWWVHAYPNLAGKNAGAPPSIPHVTFDGRDLLPDEAREVAKLLTVAAHVADHGEPPREPTGGEKDGEDIPVIIDGGEHDGRAARVVIDGDEGAVFVRIGPCEVCAVGWRRAPAEATP